MTELTEARFFRAAPRTSKTFVTLSSTVCAIVDSAAAMFDQHLEAINMLVVRSERPSRRIARLSSHLLTSVPLKTAENGAVALHEPGKLQFAKQQWAMHRPGISKHEDDTPSICMPSDGKQASDTFGPAEVPLSDCTMLLIRLSRPRRVREMYDAALPSPDLTQLDACRTVGQRCADFYLNLVFGRVDALSLRQGRRIRKYYQQ